MKNTNRLVLAILISGFAAEPTWAQSNVDVTPPESVVVLPVFIVPKGGTDPSPEQKSLLRKHLQLAQRRYQTLLRRQDQFEIDPKTVVYHSTRDLDFYRRLPGPQTAEYWTGELLDHLGFNRIQCPYVMVMIVMNPSDRFPVGGGRPINGGLNTGGGIVVMSSYSLERIPNFQSTLQHELGHSFGLPHVDVYGYSMKTNRSLMSYNPSHKTKGLKPAKRPGAFIPEDLRALAQNKRVFPELRFSSSKDVPRGYSISRNIVPLGPMNIPGQPDFRVRVTTRSGEASNTSVQNIVQKEIRLSRGPGVTFDSKSMWHSNVASAGWVQLEIRFPSHVSLTSMLVYSQHSGKYHAAKHVKVECRIGNAWKTVSDVAAKDVDHRASFDETGSQRWRVSCQAGSSKRVVIRGLRFFHNDTELFPPLVVYERATR